MSRSAVSSANTGMGLIGIPPDKTKEFQMELLMEKLRTKTSQYKTLAETSKAVRMTMLVCISIKNISIYLHTCINHDCTFIFVYKSFIKNYKKSELDTIFFLLKYIIHSLCKFRYIYGFILLLLNVFSLIVQSINALICSVKLH